MQLDENGFVIDACPARLYTSGEAKTMPIIAPNNSTSAWRLVTEQSVKSIFTVEGLRHIFYGTNTGGYHHESQSYEHRHGTSIDERTRTEPDADGIYAARVMVCGKRKRHGSYFFPRDWTKADVLRAIREAYPSLIRVRLNRKTPVWHKGFTRHGICLQLAIDADGYVRTALPLPRRNCYAPKACDVV